VSWPSLDVAEITGVLILILSSRHLRSISQDVQKTPAAAQVPTVNEARLTVGC